MYGRCFKTVKDIATTRAQIRFLTQCTKQKLIPNGLIFISQSRLHTLKAHQLEHRFAKIRLCEQLNNLHAKLFMANLHLEHSAKEAPENIKQT